MALFFPNLTFEYELACITPRSSALRHSDALIPALLALGTQDDFLYSPVDFAPSPHLRQWTGGCPKVVSHLPPGGWAHLRPWGVSPRLHREPAFKGVLATLPTVESVARVNHKGWSHHLEQKLGWGSPGAALVKTSHELAQALEQLGPGAEWVIKDPWGVAGGHRLRGGGSTLSQDQWRWVERRQLRGALLLEPWHPRIRDFSVQLEVTPTGAVEVVGVTHLLVSDSGTHMGNGVGEIPAAVARTLEEVAHKVGEALALEGYWGPAGVDAYWWCGPGGELQLRPVVEVNARYTFGRVALELGHHLPPGRKGTLTVMDVDGPLTWNPDSGLGRMALTEAPVPGARVMWVWEVSNLREGD